MADTLVHIFRTGMFLNAVFSLYFCKHIAVRLFDRFFGNRGMLNIQGMLLIIQY